MLWNIETPKKSIEYFKISEVNEVLYDFNGPKIFTTKFDELLSLWYECGDDYETRTRRYLVTPADNALIEKLKNGSRTMHEALSQPWLWAVDIDDNDEALNAWTIPHLENIPIHAKPDKNTFLWPHLEPLLSYRLIGQGISEGNVLASVVARAMEQPAAALKRLFETVNKTVSQGRPVESFRKIYDLPTQRFAFNSFEVSFAVPQEQDLLQDEKDISIYSDSSRHLLKAISWLNCQSEEELPDVGILEALKDLTPPAHGQIEKAELRGRIIDGRDVVTLTRSHRQLLSAAIKKQRQPQKHIQKIEGRVGEFDKDNLTVIIRNRKDGEPEINCNFNEDLYDDLYDAFDTDARINIFIRQTTTGRRADVVDVEILPEAEEIEIPEPQPESLELIKVVKNKNIE